MMCAKDITIETLKLKTLVMSPPLWGKTRFAATYPANTYFFDFDGNMLTVTGNSKIYYDTFVDSDLLKPTAYQEANKILNIMSINAREKGKVVLPDKNGKNIEFKHVVIDSATSLLNVAMNQVLFTKGRAGGVPTNLDWRDNDWTMQVVYFQNFLKKVLALPCMVTLNCHEHLDKTETESVGRIYPDITGKLATKIGSMFDLVFKLNVVEDKKTGVEHHVLLTKSQGQYYAGHRLADAFNTYELADWTSLLKKIDLYIEKTNKSTNQNQIE